MNDSVFLFLFVLLVVISFYLFHKGKHSIALGGLMLLGLVTRIFTALDFYLHVWDERYHALVAKNLIDSPLKPSLYKEAILPYSLTNWTANHIWLHKQPFSLWSISLSLKLFGINELSVRLPSICFSTLGIYMVYRIAEYSFGKQVAFFSAFLFAVNGLIIELCVGRVATDHPDTHFLFFILMAIFLTVKFIQKNNILFTVLIGCSLGCALLCKWLPGLIVLPVWFLLIRDAELLSFKQLCFHFAIVLTVSLVIFLPWQFFIHTEYPEEAKWEQLYNTRHFFEALEGQDGPWYYYLDKIRINYGELIYLPLLYFFYQYYKNPKNYKLLAYLVWFSVPILFFSFAATKMQAYIAIAAPALLIITAYFFVFLYNLPVRKFRWAKILVLLLLFALPIRYCMERVKPFSGENRRPEWVTKLKGYKFGKDEKVVIFGYNAPIEAMFYTNAIVYESIPHIGIIDSLKQKNYTVYINKNNPAFEQLKMYDVKGIDLVDP